MAVFINRQAPQSGVASLLALQGRGGDTELVHMTRPEVRRLQQSGLMSINPDTGLPEYFLGDVFDTVKSAVKNYFKPENIIPAIASIALPAIAGPAFSQLGLSPLATKSILSGAGTALGSLPFRSLSDSLSSGIVSGGLQYGTGKLAEFLGPNDQRLGIKDSDDYIKESRERQYLRARELSKARAKRPYLFGGDKAATNLIDSEGYRVPDIDITDYDELIPLDDPLYKDILGEKTGSLPGIPDALNNRTTAELAAISSPSNVFNLPSRILTKTSRPLTSLEVYNKAQEQFKDTKNLGPIESRLGMAGLNAEQIPRLAAERQLTADFFVPEEAYAGTGEAAYIDRFAPAKAAASKDGLQAGFKAIPDGYRDLYGELDTGAIFGDLGRGLASVEATSLVDAIEAQRMAEEEAAQQLISQGIPAPIARRRVSARRRVGEFGGTGAGLTAAEARRRAIEGGGFEFFGPTQFVPAAQGGLVGLAAGGSPDFEGIVAGDGHGMEDNQIMEIKGGGLLAVSPKEYVVPADVMAMIGNGNPDDGADEMDEFISEFRKEKYGRDMQPPEMDGGKALQSLMS